MKPVLDRISPRELAQHEGRAENETRVVPFLHLPTDLRRSPVPSFSAPLIYTRPRGNLQSTGRMDIINNLTDWRAGAQQRTVGELKPTAAAVASRANLPPSAVRRGSERHNFEEEPRGP